MDTELIKGATGLGSAGIIVAIIQYAVKPVLPNSKWYGLIAILLGIIINIGASGLLSGGSFTLEGMGAGAFIGVMAGLSAAGAYSTGQTLQG